MKQFHLIGIGGAGMSVVAELLAARGLEVSGSDAKESAVLERLNDLGITTFVGHKADQVPAGATVVVSTAVRETNPELARARQLGLAVIHRSQALALAAAGLDFVAVAGAHGKTTTSGMLSAALAQAGLDPSFAVGGTVTGFGTGARLGGGNAFIAEADESDASFLNYEPCIALVTNIEADHLDHYGSREAFEQAFVDFAARIKPNGLLVVCSDDLGAAALGQAVAHTQRVVSYGRGEQVLGARTHLRITDEDLQPGGTTFTVLGIGEPLEIHLNVAGGHNVLNAVGALAVGIELGVCPAQMAHALAAFKGTGRRFELRGQANQIRVFDDYAHHPTEVRAALAQARTVAGSGRVLVVFQPHLFSRTQNFAGEFAQALSAADVVVVTDIFAAREDPVPGIDARVITDKLPGSFYIGDRFEAGSFLAEQAVAGDIVLTMGAGDITAVGCHIVAELQRK